MKRLNGYNLYKYSSVFSYRWLIFFLLLFSRVIGQDSLSYFEKHTKINGYVKFMQTLSGDVEGNIYDHSGIIE